ncbi:MAG: insulinase family protein [Planctomycetota bacterium]|nr:MAG: insulinase family protein [Planctomycetota bacterium]
MKVWIASVLLCVLGGVFLAAEERVLAPSVPPGSEDLPHDPAYVWGQLDNGLRYALRQHGEPEGQVSLRLMVYAGSLEERDEEQGLAHYLEHMAFKGSDHFPDNSFVQVMQAYGVAHGSQSNAHTGFDETVYKLDLPVEDAQALEHGMRWFRDVLEALHLDEREVEIERGVILAEKRDRDTAQFRAAQTHFSQRYPGMLLHERWPIGIEETIRAADVATLRSFWQRWYRPDNAVVSVVGDMPMEDLRELLYGVFADMPPADEQRAVKPSRGGFAVEAPLRRISVHREDEVGATTLRLYMVADVPQEAMSQERWRRDTIHRLAAGVLSNRLSDISERADAPILSGSAGVWWWHDLRHGAVSVQVREQQVAAAAALMIEELRRFLLYGPSAAEVQQASAQALSRARQAVATADSRSSAQLTVAAYQAVKDNHNLMSPEQYQGLLQSLLADIEPEELRVAVHDIFKGTDVHHSVEVTTAHDIDETVLASAVEAAWQAVIDPSPDEELPDWPYALAQEIPEYTVEERSLGIRTATFANNAVLNIMPREEHAQQVLLQIRIGREPGAAPEGVRRLAERSFLRRGTGALRQSQIRQHLVGSSVELSVSITDDAVLMSGSSLPEDVERWLVYAAALIDDPGWREDIIEQQLRSWQDQLRAAERDLQAQMRYHTQRILNASLPDRAPPRLQVVEALTADAVEEWLAPILAQGSLEVAVVGDIDPDQVIQSVAGSIGALSRRQDLRIVEDLAQPGALYESPPLRPGTHQFYVDARVPRSETIVAWPTRDMSDIAQVRRLGQVATALRIRLREELRSAMGEAYSPFAGHHASDVWEGQGFIQAVVSVSPEVADEALQAVLRAAQGLAEEGLSEDIFTQVQRPTLSNLPRWRAENRYWLGQVVGQASSMPQRLEWAATMEDNFAAITREELSQLAAIYLSQNPIVIQGLSAETSDQDSGDNE